MTSVECNFPTAAGDKMCESDNSDSSCIANSLKYVNNTNKEIDGLESVNRAQESFRDYLFETTASIYSLRLLMVQGTKAALDFKNEGISNLQELHNTSRIEVAPLNNCKNSWEGNVGEIQKKLSEVICKQSLSIKRSLMKLSNLLTQHNLINVPHYELILYSNQIIEYRRKHCPNTFKQPTSKLSYSEALENLEQILIDVENVEDKTLSLIKNYNNVYFSEQDDSTNCDEYKDIS